MLRSPIAPWTFNPFLRILPAFVVGIFLNDFIPLQGTLLSFLICLFFLLLFACLFLKVYFLSQFRKWIGLIVFLFIVCSGSLVSWIHHPPNDPSWYGSNLQTGDWVSVRLLEDPVTTHSGYRATAEIKAVLREGEQRKVSGRIFVYFKKTDSLPAYGDVITTNRSPRQLLKNLNPGAFNFKKYAANKGIYDALYLDDKNFFRSGSDRNTLIFFLNNCRERILQTFQKFFPEKDVRGVAAALLIGYRGDLEKPLLQQYSDAGVVHVIAISGLHLGLIYVVLVWLFSRVRWLTNYVALRCWIILSLLWLFSLLTGGSPSVLRSAVMFSCILIGETYFKRSGTWNVITASAFLLLVYDPLLLYDAGFLLSYAAVSGIVAWQKPLYHSFFTKVRWLRQVWNMASVTIVAQMAAFPLCLFYFHQFPNFFLLTNLIVVPLSTVILFGEVIFLIVAPISVLASPLAFLLRFLINCMNDFVAWSNRLPFSSTHGIYADIVSTTLLYITVIFSGAWLLNRFRRSALVAFLFLSFLSAYFFALDYSAMFRKQIIFYHSLDGLVIDRVFGRRAFEIMYPKGRKLFNTAHFLGPARMVNRTYEDSIALSRVTTLGKFGIDFFNCRVMVCDRALKFEALEEKVRVNYLVITGNPDLILTEICSAVEPALVVLDATNSPWKIAQWKKECDQLHLRCFSIRDDGALVSGLVPGR